MSKEEEYHVYLPAEVLYEIFSRLPTLQPVYKFRCVSKSWNSLISSYMKKIFNSLPWIFMYDPSDQQVQLYLKQCRKFINHHDGLSFKFLLDTDPFKTQKVCFLSSCSNGLVLYSSEKPVPLPAEKNTRFYYICNPLTKQWVSLPPRPQSNGSKMFHYCTELVCDASLSHSRCNNYKVVYVDNDMDYNMPRNVINFHIFSSETGRWKTYEVPIPDRTWHGFSGLVIRHGVLYWRSKIYDDNILVACSLENVKSGSDQCRSIALPKRGRSSFFGESEGSIYYGIIYNKHDYNSISEDERTLYIAFLDVWLLEDDCTNGGLNWRMVHESIELKGYRSSLFFEAMYINPVDRNVFIIVERGCCFAYNIRTLTYEVLRGCPIPSKIKDHGLRPILITPKPTVIPSLDVDKTENQPLS